MRCPKCGRDFPRLLALSREDNRTAVCDACGMMEALGAVPGKRLTPQERTRMAENFSAAHG